MTQENKPIPQIVKHTKIGSVQSLNKNEVKKSTQANYAQRGEEFHLRNENRQTIRKIEKTATSKSPQSPQSRRLREQKRETELRLRPLENSGIRVGNKRTEDNDRNIIQNREQLQRLKATTKQAKQDVERHLIKLQRRCNHRFNKLTKHCELCGKPRSAHI